MNERIRELAKQAQLDGDAIHYYSSAFAEKFAELIVRECICVVEDAGGIDKYYYAEAISKHFEVKE